MYPFKEIVHPKMKILSSFTQFFQTCLSFLVLLITKEEILKNFGNQTVEPLTSIVIFFSVNVNCYKEENIIICFQLN